MFRRESFGGIIFEEKTHKVYTLDRPSFRILESIYQNNKTTEETVKILIAEFGKKVSVVGVEKFTKEIKLKFGDSIQSKQRGDKTDKLWLSSWQGRYFSSPVSIFWTFTNKCNLQCTHCAWDSYRELSHELDLQECYEIIDMLYTLGVFEISFSGGEPLTKKRQLLEMGRYVKNKGVHLGLATNGTLIYNKTDAEEILNAGFNEIQVSVEGIESHDKIRGRGIWAATIRGIELLRETGAEVTFAVAINKTNAPEVDNIIKLARDLKIMNVRFVRFVPIGRGLKNLDQFRFSISEEKKLASLLWQKRWENFPELIITFNKHYVSLGIMQNARLGDIGDVFIWDWDCPSGRSRACILPQGDVAPCPLIGSLGLSGGNLRESSFLDIWTDSCFFQKIRQEKREFNRACGDCQFWGKCSGGCKAASYAITGDIMTPDPLCFKNTKKMGGL